MPIKTYIRCAQWMTRVAADGPIYRAHGNSFAVPIVRWIGERIQICHRHKSDVTG